MTGKQISEMAFTPPPECATCGGLGYLLAPIHDIVGGDGSVVGDIQGEDVRCPDCQTPIDESISPAPPRHIGAGGFLVFASEDAYSVAPGYRAFVGRCGDIPTAKLYAYLALIGEDRDPVMVQYGWAQIVLGDEIIAEWWGLQWAPPTEW